MILLEKRIPFEFVNESPYSESNGVARYNPLGKVPALVTDDGECWFDSPVIAQYLELVPCPAGYSAPHRCFRCRGIR